MIKLRIIFHSPSQTVAVVNFQTALFRHRQQHVAANVDESVAIELSKGVNLQGIKV